MAIVQRWVLFCVILLAAGSAKAYEGEPRPLLKGVNQVVIYVDGPGKNYEEAARCHGIEDQCADERIGKRQNPPDYMKPGSKSREEYVAQLKSDYSLYPAALHTKSLERNVEIFVKSSIDPPVQCLIAPDNLVFREKLLQKNAMAIYIPVHFFKKIEPHIAILQIMLFRYDLPFDPSMYATAVPIPQNLTNAEIEQYVDKTIKGLVTRTMPQLQ